MMKWIIGLVVIVIAGAGLWWSGVLGPYFSMKPAPVAVQQATTTPQQTTQPAPVSDLPTSSTDASNAAIVQDSASVDAQMQSLQSDNTAADQSMNDKSTAQEF